MTEDVPIRARRDRREAARPGDDLATKLLQAEVDGKELDDASNSCCSFLLLVDAGGDTTRNLLSSGLMACWSIPTSWPG